MTEAELLADVRETKAWLDERVGAAKSARRRFERAVKDAVAGGVRPSVVAGEAGVSASRVTAIAGPAPRRQARKKTGAGSRAEESVTFAEAAFLRPDADLRPAWGSKRHLQRYGSPTAFYDPRTGRLLLVAGGSGTAYGASLGGPHPVGSIAHLLHILCPPGAAGVAGLEEVRRVYVIGPPPRDPDSGATIAEQVRGWALGAVPAGWSASKHYLRDPDLPVLWFTHHRESHEHPVRVLRAAAWWGESDAGLETCVAAWLGLESSVRSLFDMPEDAGLADTPATTGRALWLRSIPEGREWPVQSDEVRELIAATSGQGRIELLPAPAEGIETRDPFVHYDGRFMYAGLLWGMPVGEPVRVTGKELDSMPADTWERVMRGRGRWRVTVRVPDTWEHVGLLPAMLDGGSRRWAYPSRPGTIFDTWADGCEVWLALAHGWAVVVHEGLSWAEGKPLNTWADKLVSLWHRLDGVNREGRADAPESAITAGLARDAVRAIVLFTVGAFASSSHPVTRSVPVDTEQAGQLIPAGSEVRRVDESLVWEEPGALTELSARTAHPEWSATVWARARTRLLAGRDGTGALSLPPDRIVGFATDALYLAGDPVWPDDGAVGRFRWKGSRPAPWTWPATWADLYTLRDEANKP